MDNENSVNSTKHVIHTAEPKGRNLVIDAGAAGMEEI